MANLVQEEGLRDIAKAAVESLNILYGQKMGFLILAAPFGDGEEQGVGDYIGNTTRESAIKLMRETANRLDNNDTIPASKGEA